MNAQIDVSGNSLPSARPTTGRWRFVCQGCRACPGDARVGPIRNSTRVPDPRTCRQPSVDFVFIPADGVRPELNGRGEGPGADTSPALDPAEFRPGLNLGIAKDYR
jgi:hypothetical protein